MLQALLQNFSARHLPNTTLTRGLMGEEFILYMTILYEDYLLSSFVTDRRYRQVTTRQ
jgi:hypothetical protein